MKGIMPKEIAFLAAACKQISGIPERVSNIQRSLANRAV
jgi:hypothetical protein